VRPGPAFCFGSLPCSCCASGSASLSSGVLSFSGGVAGPLGDEQAKNDVDCDADPESDPREKRLRAEPSDQVSACDAAPRLGRRPTGFESSGRTGPRMQVDSTGLRAVFPPRLPERRVGLECLLEAAFDEPERESLEIGSRRRIARSPDELERRHALI